MTFELSVQQKAVLNWTLKDEGDLIILARAGCGKSFTIIEAVAVLCNSDETLRIFIGAFNKQIADEMKIKLEDRGLYFPMCSASTMHSAGFSALRKQFNRIKVDDKKVGRIFFNYIDNMSEQRQEEMKGYIRFITRTISIAKQSAFGVLHDFEDITNWEEVIDHFGLDESLPDEGPLTLNQCIEMCIKFYQTSLDQCKHTIDFDDMILAPLYYNCKFPQKDWVFIDEAQDTNSARRELAFRMVKKNGGRLVAVGDDKQAIYGFTGADSDSLEIIRKKLSAKTLPLTVTYRCAKSIIREAQKYVPDIQAHPEAEEGVIRRITVNELMQNEFQRLTPDDVILCRLNKPLIKMAYTFIKNGKGCYIEGRDVGKGLIELAEKWKRITSVPQLIEKLASYLETERVKWKAKGRPEMVQTVEDKVECIYIIADQVPTGSIKDLTKVIEKLFGDPPRGKRPRVVTLSSIHKSKGKEWKRVYSLGFFQLIPSHFATLPWQLQAEENIAYVNITRAISELVYLDIEKEDR